MKLNRNVYWIERKFQNLMHLFVFSRICLHMYNKHYVISSYSWWITYSSTICMVHNAPAYVYIESNNLNLYPLKKLIKKTSFTNANRKFHLQEIKKGDSHPWLLVKGTLAKWDCISWFVIYSIRLFKHSSTHSCFQCVCGCVGFCFFSFYSPLFASLYTNKKVL